MIKARTNSLTDMLSHGQFIVEKDAEVTHSIGGRDRIHPTCRLRFVFSRRLSVARVPNQIISDFDRLSWSCFAEHQAWTAVTQCFMFEMDVAMDVIGGSSDN